MKAIVIHKHGDPSVLRYTDVPEPALRHDEALVRVRACALNHLDLWVRRGLPGVAIPLPHIPGSDVAGEVAKVAFNLAPATKVETSLTVRVPANAKVYLAGNPTKATGETRVFRTTSLSNGKSWNDYTIKVEIEKDGKTITREEKISLGAGETKELTFEGAVRTADYDTIGRANQHRYALTWAPVEDIRFRANEATAVRAPNITELFSPQSRNFTTAASDPCDATVFAGATAAQQAARRVNCAAAIPGWNPATFQSNIGGGRPSLALLQGGNPGLGPESASAVAIRVFDSYRTVGVYIGGRRDRSSGIDSKSLS
jgi:uncharacterized protein (TIGR03000 family)